MDNKPPRHFLKIRPPVAKILLPQGVGYPAATDIEFVELGHSLHNFVIKIGGRVVLGRHTGILGGKDETPNDRIVVCRKRISSYVRPNPSIVKAAALSPLNDSYYFIIFDDGSYTSSLPKALEEMVTPHLPKPEPPSPREDDSNFIPFPLWLLSRVASGSALRIPPVSGASTQLRLLHQHDSELEDLFFDRWRCHEKPCPPIRHIYEIEMPGSLVVTYCAYRADKYNGESISQYKATLVARVVLGRSCTLTSRKEPKPLLEAPAGYDSVLGKVGSSQEYDVHAVYKDEAILPAYLIIYAQ
ncbi:hypothetical protein FRC01_011970 [Tulasnella sp. 417]|nr:hypothetical protein FRC01_011970 [Tulasnella sp. 417]